MSLYQFNLRNTRKNTLLGLELIRIIALLGDRGIRSLTFKGPVLASSVYGDLGAREFVDLDLLVEPRDAGRAASLLTEEGYERAGSGEDREYRAQSGQGSFRHPGAGYGIDLHWKLAPFGMPLPFNEADLWRDLQYLPVAGTPVPTFSWNHLALFMAFHGGKERWRSLKWICDFSELCRVRPELDWAELISKAAEAGCSRSLLVGGRLCEALGFYAPTELTEAAPKDPLVEPIVRRTVERLISRQPETELSQFSDALAFEERFRGKLRLTYNLLTTLTVSDLRAAPLPKGLRWLYYGIRPFRLTTKLFGLLRRCYRPRTAK